MSSERRYFAADADFGDELTRTRLREREIDPFTKRQLSAIGVSEGWRCLEVGAGGGSIARWLAEQVGPGGRVVAVDIDTRFLQDIRLPNVEVRQQDITKEAFDLGAYDLVHCRVLLVHMADPVSMLRRFVGATRPGGWILAEEFDAVSFAPVQGSHPLAGEVGATIHKILKFWRTDGTIDAYLGRSLPRMFNELGLVDCGNEGVARVIRGGDPWARYMEKTFQRTDDAMLAKGVIGIDILDAGLVT